MTDAIGSATEFLRVWEWDVERYEADGWRVAVKWYETQGFRWAWMIR